LAIRKRAWIQHSIREPLLKIIAFYVPKCKFDLLTVAIDAPSTKSETPQPAHLLVGKDGDVKVVTALTADVQQYDIEPVTSLDVR
jgi:hypothetical protein